MRKSKINEESGSPDELEASPLESDQGSSDDADFDRPKIKPPDPEGPKKKSKSSKREKERKRKKSDDTARNFLAPSRHDSKRDRHKRSESPPDKRLRNNQGWRAPNLYEAQRRNFRAYDGPSSREPKEMADRRGEDLRARKEKRRKHSRPEDTWRDGGNRGNNDGRYHSNETSGRDSNRKHSELSAGESSLVSKSDSFSTDKEAKEELKRIERRIAELKGTKIEDDDINENYKSSSSQDDSINSKRRSEVVKEEENATKNMSGKEESLKAKATLIDAEVEDVSASESEKSSSVSIDRNETIETEHKLGDMPLERNATAASSSDSDSEMDEAIDRPRLLPAAYSSKFDNLEESFDATEVEVVRKQQVKKGAKPGSDLQSQTSSPAHRSQIADSKGDGVVAEAAMMQRIEEAKRPLLPVYYPALQGCRSVDEFKHLNRIEEGTYGVVYRAKDLRSSEIVALKRLKMEKEREGFPITSLREINCLLKSQHPNVVPVREIVVGSNMDKIYLVMDYVEHDLKALMETMKHPFLIGETKTIMLQLLEGVKHLHDNWILHRDLKASNLLFSHKGELKIGDFGLAREYGSPLKPYTPIVVTLWYRAPELLLGTKLYSKPIDMWSVGCIFGELLSQKPMFPGKSETEQLNLIFKELGTPNEKIWPDWPNLPMVKKIVFTEYPYNNLRKRFGTSLTESGIALMNRFLTYDPKRRITASEALKHEFFKETPKPVDPSQFPTWPAKSENAYGHKKSTESGKSPKAPEGGEAYNKLLANEDDTTIGFQLTNATVGLAKRGSGFTLKF